MPSRVPCSSLSRRRWALQRSRVADPPAGANARERGQQGRHRVTVLRVGGAVTELEPRALDPLLVGKVVEEEDGQEAAEHQRERPAASDHTEAEREAERARVEGMAHVRVGTGDAQEVVLHEVAGAPDPQRGAEHHERQPEGEAQRAGARERECGDRERVGGKQAKREVLPAERMAHAGLELLVASHPVVAPEADDRP